MKEKIKELISCKEWNQAKLAEALNVSIFTVKSWTRTDPETRSKPNKWVMPELIKLMEKAGIV